MSDSPDQAWETGPSLDFLGSGWAFPPGFDRRGGTATAAYEEKVRQSIRIILETARGERVMRPTFGCGIHDYVFRAMDESTLALVRAAVEEALVLWEPRIEVVSVQAEPAAARGGLAVPASYSLDQDALLVTITYRVRRTNNEFNLVYPFFLRAGA